MELELSRRILRDDTAIITARGSLDVYTAPRLREVVIELVNSGHVWLILDLNQAEYLDSTSLGVITAALKRTRSRGGALSLVNTQERLFKIFRITGLINVFRIFSDTDTAAEAVLAANSFKFAPVTDYDADETGWHWFPARIYTSDGPAGWGVQKALREMLDAFGMEVAYEFDVEQRSWFREFIVRMKDSTATPTRDEVWALMQRALEQRAFDMPQSTIDLNQSQAVANVLIALDKTPNAVVQCGSVLVVKVQDTVIVRNLTQLEIAYWERNPGLFRDPEKALQELQRAKDTSAVQQSDTADAPWI